MDSLILRTFYLRPLIGMGLLSLALLPLDAAAEVLCSGESPEGLQVTIRIDSPAPGEELTGSAPCDGTVVVTGRAGKRSSLAPLDLYFILDSSESTASASGADVDSDGLLGVGGRNDNSDPGDSVLAAEVLAVKRLLADLRGLDIRAAVIDFSALLPDPGLGEQGRMRVAQELTSDLDQVLASLEDLQARGSAGATDYAGPLDLLLAEHAARGNPERHALAFFITDGKPTFPRYPFDSTQALDVEAALEATQRVAEAGLRLDTFELGSFDDGGLLQQMAMLTGGDAVSLLSPADLLAALPTAELGGVFSVTLVNDSTGLEVTAELSPDGTFSAEIALATGFNALRVVVVPEDGVSWSAECSTDVSWYCSEELDFCFRATTREVMDALLSANEDLIADRATLSVCGALNLREDGLPCDDGLREYLALVMNSADGRLTSSCKLDLSRVELGLPTEVDEALALVALLLESGTEEDCLRAARIAAAINNGEAVREEALPSPEPVECTVEDPESGLNVTITISTPIRGQEGPLTEPCDDTVTVEGVVEISSAANLFDLFFVIDASGSTGAASGRDVDMDGFLGTGDSRSNTDRGDSVFEAEIWAVRQFVADLDPAWARVAIIEFSAIHPAYGGRMRIVQGLTEDFTLVNAALDEMSTLGVPLAATDYGSALQMLNDEYTRNAEPATRTPICFFLSDGRPTFPQAPFDRTDPPDRQAAIDNTLISASLGIEINTFEVGQAGAADILTEMADMTGGEFFPALVAGDIIDVLNDFNLSRVESMFIENRTTGESNPGIVSADGSFTGEIGLQTGENTLVVSVTVGGVTVIVGECTTTVDLVYENLLCSPLSARSWGARCSLNASPEPLIRGMTRHGSELRVHFEPGLGALAHRAYRGRLGLLRQGYYNHVAPFGGALVESTCSLPMPMSSFPDPSALTDNQNWYYIVATLGPDGPLGFGSQDVNGDGLPDYARPRPDTDERDLVTDECP